MNRHGFSYSYKLSLPNASSFWSGNYTGQFCIPANKWHWGNRYLNIIQHWQCYLWSSQDTSRVNGHLQASVCTGRQGWWNGAKRAAVVERVKEQWLENIFEKEFEEMKRGNLVCMSLTWPCDITDMVCNLRCSKQVLDKEIGIWLLLTGSCKKQSVFNFS